MSEWRNIKLKEVLKEVSERNKDKKVKRVLSVTNSQGFVNQEEYFEGTVHSADISNYKIVRKNQFAYNPSRVNVGSIDILKDYDEGVLSPMYVIFEVDTEKLLPEYFYYYFQTHRFYENVKNNTQGSVRNSLSFKSLTHFEYLLPPKEEQEKIVHIIENTDKIIAEKKELIKEKEKLKKFYMEYIFQNKANNLKFKDVKLEDLLDFQNGLNANAEKYGNGIKYISVMDILNNTYITYDKIKGLVEVNEKIMESYKVTYGDVVFVRSSEILKDAGKSNIYLDKNKNAVFGGFVIRGKKKSDYIPVYLKYALESYDVRKQIMKYAAGNQHVNIGQESLKKVKVKYLDIKYQNIVANVFKTIDQEIEKIKEKVNEYEILKKGLMQKLLTGKVKVNG